MIVRLLENHGCNASQLLDRYEIPRERLRDPELRLDFGSVCRVWEEAATILRTSAIGLEASLLLPIGGNGLLDYLILASSTVREAVDRGARFHSLVNDTLKLSVVQRGRSVEIHVVDSRQDQSSHYAEYVLTNLVSRLRWISEQSWSGVEVHFAHTNSALRSRYETVYGCRRGPLLEFESIFHWK